MKQSRITMFVKEQSIGIKKEIREGSFRIAITIIFCLSISFFVVILAMFINDHAKKFMASDNDFYFPQIQTVLSQSSHLSKIPSHFLCNNPSPPFNLSIPKHGFKNVISPQEPSHSMTDEELMWKASMVPRIKEYPYNQTPKVAFMFLTRGRLPLGPLWEMFFRGHDGLFSIYIHTSPESTYEPQGSSVFYKRRIPSKPVQWGRSTMADAERRLLANALLDFSNERFILLSETCIPLFNFTTIYNYLINSNQSFLSSFDDPRPIGRGRYNKRMWPIVSLSDWRKGSQWFEVHRKLAIKIVSDTIYYPIFQAHCNPPCYMDEHYLATLVTKIGPEMNSNRTITWVDWSVGGSHPTRFVRKDVSQKFLKRLRNGFNCSHNGLNSSVCFLFARKFHPSTLQPLLELAPSLLWV